MTAFQETVFYRLIVNCDDFGRMDARPEILASKLYPLRRDLPTSDVQEAIHALERENMVATYEVGGRPYIQMNSWNKHQQIRAKKSKYPAPESNCNQMISDEIKCPRNPIQSESNPNPNPIQYEDEPQNDLGKVMSFFMDRINSTPSPYCVDCIKAYTDSLGAEVVIHACMVAIDEHKTGWSYIQGILQRYERDGLRSMEDVLRSEQEFQRAKERGSQPGAETSNVFLEIYDKEHGR